jgi:hypothetical protein
MEKTLKNHQKSNQISDTKVTTLACIDFGIGTKSQMFRL